MCDPEYFVYSIIVKFLKELSALGIENALFPTYSLALCSLAPVSAVSLKMFFSG